jgi:hypothetical protein
MNGRDWIGEREKEKAGGHSESGGGAMAGRSRARRSLRRGPSRAPNAEPKAPKEKAHHRDLTPRENETEEQPEGGG